MKNEIRFVIYLISIGVVLTAYAHNNFATKGEVKESKADLKSDLSDIKGELKILNERVFILTQQKNSHGGQNE